MKQLSRKVMDDIYDMNRLAMDDVDRDRQWLNDSFVDETLPLEQQNSLLRLKIDELSYELDNLREENLKWKRSYSDLNNQMSRLKAILEKERNRKPEKKKGGFHL